MHQSGTSCSGERAKNLLANAISNRIAPTRLLGSILEEKCFEHFSHCHFLSIVPASLVGYCVHEGFCNQDTTHKPPQQGMPSRPQIDHQICGGTKSADIGIPKCLNIGLPCDLSQWDLQTRSKSGGICADEMLQCGGEYKQSKN